MCNSAGICDDDERDWCPKCERCQRYDGERCATCGREWGND